MSFTRDGYLHVGVANPRQLSKVDMGFEQFSPFHPSPIPGTAVAVAPAITHSPLTMENYLLIIDSDMQELRRLREILTREGYNIMTAADKETARQICERVPVRLVLASASTIGFDRRSE